MEILLNGERREVREGTSVGELLGELRLASEQVAVELNKRLVRRAQHQETRLAPGDELEVVTLVGGG